MFSSFLEDVATNNVLKIWLLYLKSYYKFANTNSIIYIYAILSSLGPDRYSAH